MNLQTITVNTVLLFHICFLKIIQRHNTHTRVIVTNSATMLIITYKLTN